MPINNSPNLFQYTGNGVTTAFGFGSVFFALTDLVVTLYDTAAMALVAPAPVLNGAGTYDYTIAATADVLTGEYPNGTITFNNAPLGNHRATIQRQVPATQGSSFGDNTKFPGSTVTETFDRLTVLVQQALAAGGVALQFPPSDPTSLSAILPAAALRAGFYLGFDVTGAPALLTNPITGTTVSAAMVPLIQAATIAAARTVLGLGSLALSSLAPGTGPNNLVQLDGASKLPAVDGSQLTNLPLSSQFTTAMGMDWYGTEASVPAGWLPCSGKTIGNAASNGTARANADTSALFTALWNGSSNTQLQLFTSLGATVARGANAGADYAANRAIALPDVRGRSTIGKDDMGGTPAGRVTAAGGAGANFDGTVLHNFGGAQDLVLSGSQSGLPAHSHSASGTAPLDTTGASTGGIAGSGTSNLATLAVSVAVSAAGPQNAGSAHSSVQPSYVVEKIIKL